MNKSDSSKAERIIKWRIFAVTVLSFGLIAASDIPALSAIGRVVAPGALLALLLSATFAPRFRGHAAGGSAV